MSASRHKRPFNNRSLREPPRLQVRAMSARVIDGSETSGVRVTGATRTPDRSNFRSLSQAALTLGQSQLMERTMLCPRITQEGLRKPLDAGCFEGDSTRAGPKPLVQLYDRDYLRSHFGKISTRNAVISIVYGEWC